MPAPLVLVVGAAAGAIFGSSAFNPERCTFADGTTVLGRCLFKEDFSGSVLNETVWLAEDQAEGPINNLIPELGCVRHENVAVANGMLELSMTVNSRAECPQTWENTAFYQANWADWPVPMATSYDTAVITMRTFRAKYGHISFRVKAAGGVGPGPGVALWGVDCLGAPGGIFGHYLGGFFAHEAGNNCRFPARPGSTEIDMWAFKAVDPTWMNFAAYVDNSVGSPPLNNTFFGTSYYGKVWGSFPGFTAFLAGAPAPSDPTQNFHVIEVDWARGHLAFFIDGIPYVREDSDWIHSELMGAMLALTDVVTVTANTLPQKTYFDYFRWTCPPGYECESTGAAP